MYQLPTTKLEEHHHELLVLRRPRRAPRDRLPVHAHDDRLPRVRRGVLAYAWVRQHTNGSPPRFVRGAVGWARIHAREMGIATAYSYYDAAGRFADVDARSRPTMPVGPT